MAQQKLKISQIYYYVKVSNNSLWSFEIQKTLSIHLIHARCFFLNFFNFFYLSLGDIVNFTAMNFQNLNTVEKKCLRGHRFYSIEN